MQELVPFILALPLAGAVVNIAAGRMLPRRVVEAVGLMSVAGSFALALTAFMGMDGPTVVRLTGWISFAGFSAPGELMFDALSATMTLMVTGVSSVILLYSIGYMHGETGHVRFFALMDLFVFSMLLLVLASNLPLMYMGWEGVGFCSYALIGFWYADSANADAGRKAFVVTRVGDVALGVAMIWLYHICGTVEIAGINSAAGALAGQAAAAIGILLVFGAAGKSAQLPLSTWLPDAMAGPTPVSALIHAATMVTAGVYLLMRLSPVLAASEAAPAAAAAVGALTALYAASSALFQRDIKRMLAYSTMSQIGYMFLAVGAGAVGGALFHLVSHAFFKALLFMAAGCIIHALRGEQDMSRMGGLMYRMPAVFWSFLAGALALCAAPGTAGFFSKDAILVSALGRGGPLYTGLWAVGELTALVTSIYVFRAVFLVFAGEAKTDPEKVSGLMLVTLVPLALMSLAGGVINAPQDWGGSMRLDALLASQGITESAAPHHGPALTVLAALLPLLGLGVVYYLYVRRPELRAALNERYTAVAEFFRTGWGLDALYYRVFVRPYGAIARALWKNVDEAAVDGAAGALAQGTAALGSTLRLAVTGRASVYIIAVVAGGAALLSYLAWG